MLLASLAIFVENAAGEGTLGHFCDESLDTCGLAGRVTVCRLETRGGTLASCAQPSALQCLANRIKKNFLFENTSSLLATFRLVFVSACGGSLGNAS